MSNVLNNLRRRIAVYLYIPLNMSLVFGLCPSRNCSRADEMCLNLALAQAGISEHFSDKSGVTLGTLFSNDMPLSWCKGRLVSSGTPTKMRHCRCVGTSGLTQVLLNAFRKRTYLLFFITEGMSYVLTYSLAI